MCPGVWLLNVGLLPCSGLELCSTLLRVAGGLGSHQVCSFFYTGQCPERHPQISAILQNSTCCGF